MKTIFLVLISATLGMAIMALYRARRILRKPKNEKPNIKVDNNIDDIMRNINGKQ